MIHLDEASQTLLEAVKLFAKPENCQRFLEHLMSPDGVRCPHCGSDRVQYMKSVDRWSCYERHRQPQFSPNRNLDEQVWRWNRRTANRVGADPVGVR